MTQSEILSTILGAGTNFDRQLAIGFPKQSKKMPEWSKYAEKYFTEHDAAPHDRILNDGANLIRITSVGSELGLLFPDEFVDLYLVHDGIGFKNMDTTWWLTRPLDHLREFTASTCDWFHGNHADLANRFIPFIDYGNGNATGYLLNSNGEVLDGLYHFNTGAYDFDDEEQEPEEFLQFKYDSIERYMQS